MVVVAVAMASLATATAARSAHAGDGDATPPRESDTASASTPRASDTAVRRHHARPSKARATAQETADADNTGINERDRQPGAATADTQLNDKEDIALTSKIRRSIVSDRALSLSAHNVKIVSRNGAVTLKGPVKTASEKKTIEDKASALAGASKVTSELEVAP